MLRVVAWCVAVAVVVGLCWADPAPVVEYKVVQWHVREGWRGLDGQSHALEGANFVDAEPVSATLTALAAEGWQVVHCDAATFDSPAPPGCYTVIYTLRREMAARNQYDLTLGWNMIGIGELGQGQIPLSSVSISNGVETKTWDEAVAAGWIQTQAYRYETGTGYISVCPSGCAEDHFKPGCGYWMLTYVDDLTLLLP